MPLGQKPISPGWIAPSCYLFPVSSTKPGARLMRKAQKRLNGRATLLQNYLQQIRQPMARLLDFVRHHSARIINIIIRCSSVAACYVRTGATQIARNAAKAEPFMRFLRNRENLVGTIDSEGCRVNDRFCAPAIR